VLTSLALMAAPSWAAKGGNSANAKLCETESGALVAQTGSHFKNAGACTSYAAKGGELAKLEVHIKLESNCFGTSSCRRATASGFGLKPATFVVLKMLFTAKEEVNEHGVVAPFSANPLACPDAGEIATAKGTLASGVAITATATEPLCG
jgi:hypothetical protein